MVRVRSAVGMVCLSSILVLYSSVLFFLFRMGSLVMSEMEMSWMMIVVVLVVLVCLAVSAERVELTASEETSRKSLIFWGLSTVEQNNKIN